jgi:hypothetical protein
MKSFNNCQYVNTKNNYYHIPGVSYSQKIDSNFNQSPPLYELGPKDIYLKPYYTYTIGYSGEPDKDPNFLNVGFKMKGNDGSIYVVVRDFGVNKWVFDESQCKDTFNYCGNLNYRAIQEYKKEQEEIKKEDSYELCSLYTSKDSCNNNNSLVINKPISVNCPENLKEYCFQKDKQNNQDYDCGCYRQITNKIKGIDYNCNWNDRKCLPNLKKQD